MHVLFFYSTAMKKLRQNENYEKQVFGERWEGKEEMEGYREREERKEAEREL